MPNMLHTLHSWSGYTTTKTTTTKLQRRMLAKRALDGTGLTVFIIIGVLIAVVLLGLMIRWAQRSHIKQYNRSGGRARWSVHHHPQSSRHPKGTNWNADPEQGYGTPQMPPPAYQSRSQRNDGTRGGGSRRESGYEGPRNPPQAHQSRSQRQQGSQNDGTRPEPGYEMPQFRPQTRPQTDRSRSQRSHGSQSERSRPSQTMQHFLQSQGRSGSARRGTGRGGAGRDGAPSAQEYFGGR